MDVSSALSPHAVAARRPVHVVSRQLLLIHSVETMLTVSTCPTAEKRRALCTLAFERFHVGVYMTVPYDKGRSWRQVSAIKT